MENSEESEIFCNMENFKESEIFFNVDAGKWVMKLTKSGIVFNREIYPDSSPDDFAKVFIDILEKEYIVKFEKKAPLTIERHE